MAGKAQGDIIVAAQTLTEDWADLGGEIETTDYSFFTSFISLDINDSEGVQFRYVYLLESGGEEYPMQLKGVKTDKVLLSPVYFEVTENIDQEIPIDTEIDKTVNLIKIQVKARETGVTPGQITKAIYRQGYRQ